MNFSYHHYFACLFKKIHFYSVNKTVILFEQKVLQKSLNLLVFCFDKIKVVVLRLKTLKTFVFILLKKLVV